MTPTAVYDEPMLRGSSSLAEELPALWPAPAAQSGSLNLPRQDQLGILCTVGSLMPQSRTQIETLVNCGAHRIPLIPERLFNTSERGDEIARLSNAIATCLQSGQEVVFHSPNEPVAVKTTRTAESQVGRSGTEVAGAISTMLAEVTAHALAQTGLSRLVVAGGETSAAVCARLGITRMRVWQEISPGLPSCLSLDSPLRLLVLKSGSFGAPDFFQQAIAHLRAQ